MDHLMFWIMPAQPKTSVTVVSVIVITQRDISPDKNARTNWAARWRAGGLSKGKCRLDLLFREKQPGLPS
jgi:hypothetical protein